MDVVESVQGRFGFGATRGNCVGLLLGHLQEHMQEHAGDTPRSLDKGRINRLSKQVRGYGLEPPRLAKIARIAVGYQADDEKLIEWVATAYLARAPEESTLENLRDEVQWCREHFDIDGPLLSSGAGNRILCHLAYTLLLLPIAQLG